MQNTIEVTLQGPQLTELERRYGDTRLSRAYARVLTGNGELTDRVDTITHLLMLALRAATTNTPLGYGPKNAVM
jgi:hypothetical protein